MYRFYVSNNWILRWRL